MSRSIFVFISPTRERLPKEVTSAGFFVQPPHEEELFLRICPATKYDPRYGYSGNSFWIAYVANQWFLGTWGGHLYVSYKPEQLGQLTVEWFKHKPNGTAWDFEHWIVEKYGLQSFDNDEFDALLGD